MTKAKLLVAFALIVAACDRGKSAYDGPPGPIARVFVDSVGAVTLNGNPVDSTTLADSLRALSVARGGLIYSRANPDREPNPNQDRSMRRVMTEILNNKLPVRLVRPESLATAG